MVSIVLHTEFAYLAGDVDGTKVVAGWHHHGPKGERMGNLEISRHPFRKVSLPTLKELLCQAHIYKSLDLSVHRGFILRASRWRCSNGPGLVSSRPSFQFNILLRMAVISRISGAHHFFPIL